MKDLIPTETIDRRIYLIRGQKVMLNLDLASLYGVETKALNQAIQRNLERFPEDFMFKLTDSEFKSLRFKNGPPNLRSQIVTSSWGGHRYLPYAFTEQGIAMLSSVLKSRRAIQVNIAIMRAFVKLKQYALTHADLARKIDTLEKKYDAQFRAVFDAIRALMQPSAKPAPKIGFKP